MPETSRAVIGFARRTEIVAPVIDGARARCTLNARRSTEGLMLPRFEAVAPLCFSDHRRDRVQARCADVPPC
jgi:hypothetical protein